MGDKQKTKILVTGVFDILHQEHLNFLKKAKQLGDVLVVGVESDLRVKKMKGEGRPVNKQEQRKVNLEKLNIADEVFILPEKFASPADHLQLLQKIKPDILAVSSHTAFLDKKEKSMQEIGGRVAVVHQHNPNISTTKILEKTS